MRPIAARAGSAAIRGSGGFHQARTPPFGTRKLGPKLGYSPSIRSRKPLSPSATLPIESRAPVN